MTDHTRDDEGPNAPLMPLSMPPFAPLAPTVEPPAPSDDTWQRSAVPSVMPLSMPPFSAGDDRALPGSLGAVDDAPTAEVPASPPPPPWVPSDLAAYPGATPDGGTWRRPSPTLALLLVVALVAGAIGGSLGVVLSRSNAPASSSSPSTLPASRGPANAPLPNSETGSVAAIAEAAEPAVVDINTNVAASGQAAGTGMIITRSGEVLTNNHVVEQATTISVQIPGVGQRGAKVLGVDPGLDIALLQIEGASTPLKTVVLGDSSKVKLGDKIVAIGNAYGLSGSPSVVTGTISATDRSITASDQGGASSEQLSGLLQITAPIVPGDSGGPLLDTSGEVVGMDTAAATEDGGATVGFAIPINRARQIVSQIESGHASNGIILGESAFLGVQFFPSDYFGFGSTTTGAQVAGVVANGPAAAAGIAPGDVITALDGRKVSDSTELSAAIATHRPGDKVSVSLIDNTGSARQVTVILGGIPK